ncbi:MAG: hypothetical protein KKD39_02690, partial [Candidatus Altiarchaeota archaeon]|nr:hypothetical protein [Candidatus Altiarchaeota archaeon]
MGKVHVPQSGRLTPKEVADLSLKDFLEGNMQQHLAHVSALVDGARKACLGSQNRFFVFKAKDLTYVVDTGEVDEGSDELKKS